MRDLTAEEELFFSELNIRPTGEDFIEATSLPWDEVDHAHIALALALGLTDARIDAMSPDERQYYANLLQTISVFTVTSAAKREVVTLPYGVISHLHEQAQQAVSPLGFLQSVAASAAAEKAQRGITEKSIHKDPDRVILGLYLRAFKETTK
jgi:hypothetical protein